MEEAGAARRRSGRSGGEGRTGLAMEKAVWSGAKRGAGNGEDTKTVKAVFSSTKNVLFQKKFSVTSNLRYMHGVLDVDEIKN
jgi:hypothetical protein